MRRLRKISHNSPCMYYCCLTFDFSVCHRSSLLFILGKESMISILVQLSPEAIATQPISRILYWLCVARLREMVLAEMSHSQRLAALVFHATAVYSTADTVNWMLDSIHLTDHELDTRVHPEVMRRAVSRGVPAVFDSGLPGHAEQDFLMAQSHSTRGYASHPRVLTLFVRTRGWLPL